MCTVSRTTTAVIPSISLVWLVTTTTVSSRSPSLSPS